VRRPAPVGGVLLGLATILATGLALSAKPPAKSPGKTPAAPAAPRFDFQALQLAIADLTETFGPRYPRGKEYLARLEELEKSAQTPQALQASLGELNAL